MFGMSLETLIYIAGVALTLGAVGGLAWIGAAELRVRNLRRSFGTVHAVQDVSFSIRKGQVVGFIGANGAGKTTTLRLLATLDTPDAGTISIVTYERRVGSA